MILVDANLLVYAHVVEAPEHAAAREWLDGRLNGTARVGLPWPSLLAFLRLLANPRVVAEPRLPVDSWRVVEQWLAQDPVWIPEPTHRHREVLGGLLNDAGSSPHGVPDVHLAALAIEHGLTLCTTDGGFARFTGLRRENPLRPASAGAGAPVRPRVKGRRS